MTIAQSRPKRSSRLVRSGSVRAATGTDPRLFDRPLVTVDVVILSLGDRGLRVLLVRRATSPFAGLWALPGGFIHPAEDTDLDSAARRTLREKTGIESPYLEQLRGFGNARRDPRGWTATFAYFALVGSEALVLKEGGNAEAVEWLNVDDLDKKPTLAFDHNEILASAVGRLRSKVKYTSLPVHLLSTKFTLPDLQRVYEDVLGRKIDKSAFRKRMAEADFLEPIPGEFRFASNRPAQLYRVKRGHKTIFFDRTI